ncbi:helix-turn-helix domain-containing protein [Clostridium botulinum]|uniref:helix-turn-helix domain-containing protein n=1 Tax=Clostridium botulinum TaxID=1491 RepID=UPI001E3ECE79|nr:helix-turn-helix transcriptional regulator [Clostridium botulinum]MCC5437464.1 helix-turn-helix transcriptional regulator [Clostridium botulinum]NFR57431.1 helix-turn-helix transcriptional regulator [Clostridium botulinum]
MEIGKKLKNVRTKSSFTQEKVAEEIQVSRQTISNWENEKSYPDIISVIKLSDFYNISLDELLKGDSKMIEHLDESINVVKSNKKLLLAIAINGLLMILLVIFNSLIPNNTYLLLSGLIFLVLTTATLFYQIICKF